MVVVVVVWVHREGASRIPDTGTATVSVMVTLKYDKIPWNSGRLRRATTSIHRLDREDLDLCVHWFAPGARPQLIKQLAAKHSTERPMVK